MKARYDVQFWTAHPSAVLLLNSFSWPSSEAGFTLKASLHSLVSMQAMQSFLPTQAEGNLMTDTQPHGFPLCSCHFMFLSAACKASPALWLCGCWSNGAGAQVRTDTPHVWKHTLSSELRKELRNSLLGRQIAAPCLQRCLDLCFLRQPAPLGKISGQISLKSSRHSFCEPTERELQKTTFTKQTHTALNTNYKQQFSRYNPTIEMFPHSRSLCLL